MRASENLLKKGYSLPRTPTCLHWGMFLEIILKIADSLVHLVYL